MELAARAAAVSPARSDPGPSVVMLKAGLGMLRFSGLDLDLHLSWKISVMSIFLILSISYIATQLLNI